MSKVINHIWQKVLNLNAIFLVLLVVTVVVSIQQYLLPEMEYKGQMYPRFNNYLIFTHSFSHLINNQDLYAFYTFEYGDLFKYSPTFALFMGAFYFLPDWLGLIGWNFLNVLVLFFGIRLIPNINDKTKAFILLFVLFELIGNMQNEQSNTLMGGLMVLSFGFFEKKKLMLAALMIALSIYIKLFGIVACALFILYPNRFRFIAFFVFWMVVLWTLPLIILSPDQLIIQYADWIELLKSDNAYRYGFSVFGVLHKWFLVEISKWYILTAGIMMFCLVYIRRDLYKEYGFRLLFLSSILLWTILFNHTAESSGYIICMTGIGIWYFNQEMKLINTILAVAAFTTISLVYTDLTPVYYRHTYLMPYYIKTIPVIIIWLKILYEMLFQKYKLKDFKYSL